MGMGMGAKVRRALPVHPSDGTACGSPSSSSSSRRRRRRRRVCVCMCVYGCRRTSEERDGRLDQSAARLGRASRDAVGEDGLLDKRLRVRLVAVDAGGARESAVRLDQPVLRKTCHELEAVDILAHDAQQPPMLVQRANEHVCRRRSVHAGIQLLGQHEKWRRVTAEVVQLEHGGRVRQIVLLQVRIETGVGLQIKTDCKCDATIRHAPQTQKQRHNG